MTSSPARPLAQPMESCPHTHVREVPQTVEKDGPHSRHLEQRGACLLCGFWVLRRTESVAFGPWHVQTGEAIRRV